jgi:tetratricopeptide (TPR) repeat protein
LFAPQLLGSDLPWEAGLSTLVFAVVNLHHFVLDGAVWKLRDGRVARLLLRPGAAGPSTPGQRPRWRGRWPAAALWTVGGMCLVIEVGELARQQAERRGAYALAGRALDGLSWLGRDHAFGRIRLGRALLDAGQYADARVQFRRSASDRPTAAAWGGLGRALAGEGDLRGAAEAYEAGLEIAPGDAALLRSAGAARLALGEPARAVTWLERALERQPGHRATQRALRRARRALAAPPADSSHFRGEIPTEPVHSGR